jgi:hypothetical protein
MKQTTITRQQTQQQHHKVAALPVLVPCIRKKQSSIPLIMEPFLPVLPQKLPVPPLYCSLLIE